MKKRLVIITAAILAGICAYGQDTIVKKDNEKIICKISAEDSSSIYFRIIIGNKNVETYVRKAEVSYVKYYKSRIIPEKQADKISIGPGHGQIFGGFGANFTVYPVRNLGIFAAAGYTPAGLAYNAGIKVRFLKEIPKSTKSIYLIGMYGYNAAVILPNDYEESKLFYGISAGLGLDLKFDQKSNWYLTASILYPFKSPEVQEYVDYLKTNYNIDTKRALLPLSISLGCIFILSR